MGTLLLLIQQKSIEICLWENHFLGKTKTNNGNPAGYAHPSKCHVVTRNILGVLDWQKSSILKVLIFTDLKQFPERATTLQFRRACFFLTHLFLLNFDIWTILSYLRQLSRQAHFWKSIHSITILKNRKCQRRMVFLTNQHLKYTFQTFYLREIWQNELPFPDMINTFS